MIDICGMSLDQGNGDSSIASWYYNIEEEKCLKFNYKGSGGNLNRFLSEQDCEAACKRESNLNIYLN